MPVLDLQNETAVQKYLDFTRNAPQTSVTQDIGWGRVKNNWEPLYVYLTDDAGNITDAMSILMIKNGDGRFAYASKGPVTDPTDITKINQLIAEAEPVLREKDVFLLRMDPEVPYSDELRSTFEDNGFKIRSREVALHDTIQPRMNFLLDLKDTTPDDLIMSFRYNTRYEIRQSIKRGLEVTFSSDSQEDMDKFYETYESMSKHHGISYRPRQYFYDLLNQFGPSGILRVYLAYVDNEVVAGALGFNYGDKVWYMYGGSTGEGQKYAPAYGIQWAMINWAIETGKTKYDFGGVFALDKSDGLYVFKHGFSHEPTEYLGEIDKVYDEAKYEKYLNN